MRRVVKEGKTVEEAVEKGLKTLGLSRDEVKIEVLEEPKGGLFGLFSREARVEICEKEEKRTEPSFDSHESLKGESLRECSPKEVLSENFSKDSKEVLSENFSKDSKESVEKSSSEAFLVKEQAETSKTDQEPLAPVNREEVKEKARQFLETLLSDFGFHATVECFEREDRLLFNIVGVEQKQVGILIGKRGETLDAIQYLTNLVTRQNRDNYCRITLDINNYRARREKTLKNLARRKAKEVLRTNRPVRLDSMNPYERRIIHATAHEEGVETKSEGEEPMRYVIIMPKE